MKGGICMSITPCGKRREKLTVAKVTTANQKIEKKEYPLDYLVRKVTLEVTASGNSKIDASIEAVKKEASKFMKDGDELWFYDDHETPLCGSFGYVILRNGDSIVKDFPLGRY